MDKLTLQKNSIPTVSLQKNQKPVLIKNTTPRSNVLLQKNKINFSGIKNQPNQPWRGNPEDNKLA